MNKQLASITDAELIEQNANQYKAIIHMARSLALVHGQRLPHVHKEPRGMMEAQFESGAYIMEALYAIRVNIDAWDEIEDEWMDPVFKVRNEWMARIEANVKVEGPAGSATSPKPTNSPL